MNKSSCSNTTASDIEVVNALYRKCIACSDELSDAYAAWEKRRDESAAIRELQQKYAKASKAFDDFKTRMVGEIKFDIERGEYFPAKDESGYENFRVKVTRTQTLTMTIASESEELAIQTARAAIVDGRAPNFGPITHTYENISR